MEFIKTTVEEMKKQEDKIGKREGIPIEKGVVLTEPYLSENQELMEKYVNYFSVYPDV